MTENTERQSVHKCVFSLIIPSYMYTVHVHVHVHVYDKYTCKCMHNIHECMYTCTMYMYVCMSRSISYIHVHVHVHVHDTLVCYSVHVYTHHVLHMVLAMPLSPFL